VEVDGGLVSGRRIAAVDGAEGKLMQLFFDRQGQGGGALVAVDDSQIELAHQQQPTRVTAGD
jgi:hypothetical protein